MSGDIQKYDSGAVAGGPATDTPTGGSGGFASPSGSAGRRAEIEAIMRSDIESYHAQGLDREYAAILANDVAEVDPDKFDAASPMHWEDGRRDLSLSALGRALVQEWSEHGAFRPRYERVQKEALDVVRAIGASNRERLVFTETFDRCMTEGTRLAVYREIAAGAPGYVEPVGRDGLAKFAGCDAGKDLVTEWGVDAPRRIATFWNRVERLKQMTGAEGFREFAEWFDLLKPKEAKAIASAFSR